MVGSINADLVLTLDRLPRPGETVLAVRSARHQGGKGANAACAAARWGARWGVRRGAPTVMVALVGQDQNGREAVADLESWGVSTDEVEPLPDVETGQAVILVDTGGENSIVVDSGANALLDGPRVEAALTRLHLRDTDVVVTNGEVDGDAVAAVARTCTERSVLHVHNLAPVRAEDLRAAPSALLLLNEVELAQVADHQPGDSRSRDNQLEEQLLALAADRPAVVVTRGAQGAWFATGDRMVAIPAEAAEIVDTTGAGDAFCGALAAELASGAPLSTTVPLAVRAGSRAVTAAGARGALARREDVASV